MSRNDLVIAPTIAIVWFLSGVLLASRLPVLWVWHDQTIFAAAGRHLHDPYQTPFFVNPPWAALLMVPFTRLPLALAVLSQMVIMFTLLAFVIRKFGGSTTEVILCLTSFFAFMQTFMINNDWLVYLGLLAPPFFSGLFLLIKPQIALGVWLAYKPRALVIALAGLVILLLLSGIIWGAWISKMLISWQRYMVEGQDIEVINLAPIVHLPVLLSLLTGGILMWRAIRKQDEPTAILGWLFFVPYLPLYSVLLYFGMLVLRWPLLAKIIYGATWLIYGGVLVLGLFINSD